MCTYVYVYVYMYMYINVYVYVHVCGTCVIVAGKSSQFMAAVLVLNTPDDGRLRPKHVE